MAFGLAAAAIAETVDLKPAQAVTLTIPVAGFTYTRTVEQLLQEVQLASMELPNRY